jgi:Uma2 family endonuclease
VALPSPRQFTVNEYYRMAEAGILGEDDRVELIEGEIIEMPSIGPGHAGSVKSLISLFTQGLGEKVILGVQDPLHLDAYNEPEPDLMLLRPRADFYTTAHPRPADVLLLVEVGATSAARDRRLKLPLYARNSIPEVWLIDPARTTVRAYRDPSPTGYRTARTYRPGERLAPLAFPDLELPVADILRVGYGTPPEH